MYIGYARELGALVAALGGLDGLVFTAGIGEHAPEIRRRVCEKSAWLGLVLDTTANEQGAERISAEASRVPVWAIPTDEERTIARQTIKVLRMHGADLVPPDLALRFVLSIRRINHDRMLSRPFGSRKGLVLGIPTSTRSPTDVHWGSGPGAELAITYLNSNAKPYVELLAKKREAAIFLPCDVMVPEQRDTVFHEMERTWEMPRSRASRHRSRIEVPDLLPTSQIGLIRRAHLPPQFTTHAGRGLHIHRLYSRSMQWRSTTEYRVCRRSSHGKDYESGQLCTLRQAARNRGPAPCPGEVLLVADFVLMHPENALWMKTYHVYANIDTEPPRFLQHEKWWGSPVLMNADEMQCIVSITCS